MSTKLLFEYFEFPDVLVHGFSPGLAPSFSSSAKAEKRDGNRTRSCPGQAPETRLLSREAAANYCGVSFPTFKAACSVAPIKIQNRVLYDRRELDVWIDSLETDGSSPTSNEELLKRLDHVHANKRH